MKKLVILTGAGISAESGIRTFRDSDGLWEEHRVEDVATPEAWQRNPALVQRFYNERRKQLDQVEPNAGHRALAELERYFDVSVITQNVDDLHERAGAGKVLHLHGELRKVRSTVDPNLVYTLDHWEVKMGDKCEKGSQLRPHIVWFGEAVPEMERAIELAEQADIFCIVGTSLNVYPAAGLLHYAPSSAPVYLVDPNPPTSIPKRVTVIAERAGTGVSKLMELLKPLA